MAQLRSIKTLAAIFLSRHRPRLPNLAPFSASADSNVGRDVTPTAELDATNLSRESVIYGLKKLDKAPAKALDLFRWVEGRSPAQLGQTAYALMLRILARKDWLKDFWVVVDEMPGKGVEMDMETFETLVCSLGEEKLAEDVKALRKLYGGMAKGREMDNTFNAAVEVISRLDWDSQVEKRLDEIALSVTDKICLRMLWVLLWKPEKAMGFFRWAAGRGNGYKHSSTVYNTMARILAKNDLVDEFWALVKEMKNEGFDIDIDNYVKLLRHFKKKWMMKEAVELYEMMMAGPYKPPEQDCGNILRHFSLSDDVDFELVSRVCKVHEASCYCMTKSIYDAIHRGLTSQGRFDEAEKTVKTMRLAGFEPDNIIYSQIVFGLCKFGKFDDACLVLDDMEKHGCPPDIKTWTILIQGHCVLGQVDQALSCYQKMIHKNTKADADLLQVLVKGLLGKKEVEKAYKMVTELVNVAKMRPREGTFKLLIEGLLGAKNLEEALNVLKLMKEHDYPPFTGAFVSYISKFGTFQDGVEYFKVLSVMQNVPDLTSYLNVFRSLFEEGRQSEAKDLLHKCPYLIRSHGEILKVFAAAKA